MSWNDLHQQSAEAAISAAEALRGGNRERAEMLYSIAADAEREALRTLPRDKPRTLGIMGVSAASLFFKSKRLQECEALALELLREGLPSFAKRELQTILQAVWNEEAKVTSELQFMPGHVFVSVRGGEVVTGGAPLDLIIEKVQAVRSLFIRTVEYMQDFPLRKAGRPKAEVLDTLRPWIFQAPAGSYQFAIAVQGPSQPDLFDESASGSHITDRFLQIVHAASSSEPERLREIVPDEDYRRTFVQLTRQLLPRKNRFDEMVIYSIDGSQQVTLTSEATKTLRAQVEEPPVSLGHERPQELHGILRALDLNRDWLDVVVNGRPIRVRGLQETVDDVIGPLVNRKVAVRVRYRGKTPEFVDIDLDD